MASKGASPTFYFLPQGRAQLEATQLYPKSDILFLEGPGGTGKSHCALALALQDVLSDRKKFILYTKPAVTAGRDIGFLPGTLAEKTEPLFKPLQTVLNKMVYKLQPGLIETSVLAYMRGETYDNCVMILDEAQNASIAEFRLFLSRCGKDSKVIISGDPDQSDIEGTNADYYCDFDSVCEKLEQLAGVNVVVFDGGHSFRHPRLTKWLEALRS